MPRKHTIKNYEPNGYYHVFNRGIDGHRIFEDKDDYLTFLKYFEIYLSPLNTINTPEKPLRSNLIKGNLAGEVELLAYCLMPNHYHMLLTHTTQNGIEKFMRQLTSAYSSYFNKRYKRMGPLFQSTYKAIQVDTEPYLIHLSRYIHQNPLERGAALKEYIWSSYQYYLKESLTPPWLSTETLSSFFNQNNPNLSYESFVEDTNDYALTLKDIKHLALDLD